MYSLLENPLASALCRAPCVDAALSAASAQKLVTYLGGFGAPSLKPLGLFSNHPPDLVRTLLRLDIRASRRRLAANASSHRLFEDAPRTRGSRTRSTSTGWRSDVWVNGKRLAASAVYPTDFAVAMCALVMQALGQ